MSKIYGYREKDVLELAQFLLKEKEGQLSEKFQRFAINSGKAKGTVRNLYYALAKMSQSDQEFCDKYLGGKAVEVEKIVSFSEVEERKLIKDILTLTSRGVSVRKAIKELSEGQEKVALRYQNKYRNAISKKPELIKEIKEQLKEEGVIFKEKDAKNERFIKISDEQFEKLKKEIDGLVGRIQLKERKENEYLRQKIAVLEKENLRLANLLYRGDRKVEVLDFFRAGDGKGHVH